MDKQPWITASRIGVRGPRGWAFRDVSLDAPYAAMTVIGGPAGSGRTSLLLALAGRMKLTEGTATVAGADLPRDAHRAQRVTALGVMRTVNELEPELTVAEHIREAMDIRFFLGRERARLAEAMERTRLDVDPTTPAFRLGPADRQLLGVTMALTGFPEVVFLDDVDDRLSPADQHILWSRLAAISAEHDLTILAACTDPEPAKEFARIVRPLEPAPGPAAPRTAPDAEPPRRLTDRIVKAVRA